MKALDFIKRFFYKEKVAEPIQGGIMYRKEQQRAKNQKRTLMTKQELCDYACNYLASELQKSSVTITKTSSSEPQIWFKDANEEEFYVIVHTVCANIPNSVSFKFDRELMDKLVASNVRGYYAKVGLFSRDCIILDDEGEIVPLSKRDDINNPVDTIYTDTELLVMFEGFHPIVPPKTMATKTREHTEFVDCNSEVVNRIFNDLCKAWNDLDADLLIKNLDESFIYDSQWVQESLDYNGYTNYIRKKFETIRESLGSNSIHAHIIEDTYSVHKKMVAIQQGESSTTFYRIVIRGGKVIKGDLCMF